MLPASSNRRRCSSISLSEFWHEAIPDAFIHNALDAFGRHPHTVIQILTKRPGRMRRIICDRYYNSGPPAHIWFGGTCADNRVKCTSDILRATKDRVGDFMAFASIEPDIFPIGPIEEVLVDRIVNAIWRLRRLARAETALFHWRVYGLKAEQVRSYEQTFLECSSSFPIFDLLSLSRRRTCY